MIARRTTKGERPTITEISDLAVFGLKTLRDREAQGKRLQNDPSYPRRKCEKFAISALVCCSKDQEPPPFELVELVAHLFGLPAETMWPEKREEYYKAAEYLAFHREASDREVARAVGVHKDTIKRWKVEPEFQVYKTNLIMSDAMRIDWGEFMDALNHGDEDEAWRLFWNTKGDQPE